MEAKLYTVTEFNRSIKSYLEGNDDYRNFYIEGELSNVVYYKSGHLYFNLKDKKAQIKCAAFNYKYKKISEDLKEGDSVKIFGDVGFYEARGDFQVLVRHIEKKNILGEMYAKLEKVKAKMEKEGYFDEKYKQKLPKYPKNIGVVTAITGAAIHDIIKTAKKRDDRVNIYIYPAKVQGVGAEKEIIKGIEILNKIPEIDIIIAGRGGGSIEDLWAFNEENVAKAFFNSKKPIISAVGHEIDYMLTDMVADSRAATPTQAIELSVPEKDKIIEVLEQKEKYLKTLLLNLVDRKREKLKLRYKNYHIKNFQKIILDKNQILIQKEEELNREIFQIIKRKENMISERAGKLISLNPLAVLERGYSVVSNSNGVVKSKKDIKLKDSITIRLNDGNISAIVEEI